jgi:hypothetical protein
VPRWTGSLAALDSNSPMAPTSTPALPRCILKFKLVVRSGLGERFMSCNRQLWNALGQPGMGENPCASRLLASNKQLTITPVEHKILPPCFSPGAGVWRGASVPYSLLQSQLFVSIFN